MHTPAVQEHILKHGGDKRLYIILLQLAGLTHLAYDCPKKHSAVNVLPAARALLAEAPWVFKCFQAVVPVPAAS